jgi:hypothetical protein
MKKLVAISLLLVLMSTAAFAQFKVGFTADTLVDLMYIEKDTSDGAADGSVDILSNHNHFDHNELRLNFKYTGENFEAFLDWKLDALVTQGAGLFAGTATVNQFFAQGFGDYYVKGTAGIFNGYVGNTAQRGKVKRFENPFNDFFGQKQDNYGILVPDATVTPDATIPTLPANIAIAIGGSDSNNLKNDTTYMSLGVNFAAFTVEAAGGLDSKLFTASAGQSHSSINAALRFSGENVADIVNFDVTYKISGKDDTTTDIAGNQPDGDGRWGNSLGLYANLNIIPVLGIGVGYTAGFTVQEDTKTAASTEKNKHPFYSGIDTFGIVASAAYNFNEHVGLEAGLDFSIASNTFKTDGLKNYGAPSDLDEKGGTFKFGIPIRFIVSF